MEPVKSLIAVISNEKERNVASVEKTSTERKIRNASSKGVGNEDRILPDSKQNLVSRSS